MRPFVFGRCIRPLELRAIGRAVLFFYPSSVNDSSHSSSQVFSWHNTTTVVFLPYYAFVDLEIVIVIISNINKFLLTLTISRYAKNNQHWRH